MPLRIPWSWETLPAHPTPEEISDRLNQSLGDLDQYLRLLHQEVSFGPIAGAYLPVDLGRTNPAGTALPTGVVDQFPFGFELRPISITFICYGGDLTVKPLSQSSAILTSGGGSGVVSLSDSIPLTLNSRGDFSVEKVTGDLSIEIISIDGGTPIHLRVTILCKNASKVEPA